MNTAIKSVLASFICAIALSGCSGVKDNLGLTRSSPDEFAVVKRAPLEIPENIEALPPPRPGASRPQEKSQIAEAKQAVFGATPENDQSPASKGEAQILELTGAQDANPAIRTEIDQETAELAQSNRAVADKLLNWTGGGAKAPASVVDAKKEAARLKENLEAGKSPTEGETPVVRD